MGDLSNLPRPTDVALQPGYHSPQVSANVRLNTNEAPLPPPQDWLEELAGEVSTLVANRYPDRQALKLREAIAAHHGVDYQQVFCANGSNEVLQCLYLAYAGPGRQVAVFEPTYALHSHIARLTGSTVVTGGRAADWTVDVAEAKRLLAATAARSGVGQPTITMLCSPNNPTGRTEPAGNIAALAQAVPGLLIVDEAYGQFAPHSALELLGGGSGARNVVVVRTFSKTWAMAALRLGYLVADPEIVRACEQVALPYHLDALKQAAGVLALKHTDEMNARIAAIVSECRILSNSLLSLGAEVWPSEANFILFRLPGRRSTSVWQALVDKSVLIRDVSGWPGLEQCLRVTVGTADENAVFFTALQEVLEQDAACEDRQVE